MSTQNTTSPTGWTGTLQDHPTLKSILNQANIRETDNDREEKLLQHIDKARNKEDQTLDWDEVYESWIKHVILGGSIKEQELLLARIKNKDMDLDKNELVQWLTHGLPKYAAMMQEVSLKVLENLSDENESCLEPIGKWLCESTERCETMEEELINRYVKAKPETYSRDYLRRALRWMYGATDRKPSIKVVAALM